MSLQDLENKARELFESYVSDTKLEQVFDEFTNLSNLNVQNREKSVLVLRTIGSIFQIKFRYIKSDGLVMTTETSCLVDLFRKLSETHVHSEMRKGKLYVCDYHQESLFLHLHLAMMVTFSRVPFDMPFDEMLRYAFIALVHDIGKVKTVDIIKIKDYHWTRFSGHGEIGSGILSMIWNHDFEKYFTKIVWENICRTVAVHMCGYHETNPDSIQAKYCWNLLKLENENVKDNLYYLSIADHYGAIPKEPHHDHTEFDCSRNDFKMAISETFNSSDFYKNNELNGMIILVRGMSGSGKSSYVKRITDRFNELNVQYTIIERDEIMCQIAAKSIGEICTKRSTGEQYKKYYDIYQSKNLGFSVNEEMKNRISQSLSENRVVILDTVMSLFKPIDNVLPNIASTTFIVAIDIIRCTKFTESDAMRMGYDIDKQVQLHGSRDIFYWLPEDTKNRLLEFSSYSTSKISSNKNVSRPRLVFQVAWKNEYEIGNDEVMRQLDELVKPFIGLKVTENESSENDIVSFVNYLYQKHGYQNMRKFIVEKGFTVCVPPEFKNTPYDNRVIRIKYIDTNRLWKPKWTRQCRGVTLLLNDSDEWVCVKYQLQRGAEVLTGIHLKADITETESFSMTDFGSGVEILDENQQETIKLLMSRSDINAILSFKSDGSLFGVNMYSGKYKTLMTQLIQDYADEFCKTVLQKANELELPFVPIFSSQATFFLGDMMHDYMVTAILGDSMIPESEFSNYSPIEAFRKYGDKFLLKLKRFYELYPEKNDVMTLSFEARCRNRRTAWGKNHSELTIAYETSGLKCLGLSLGDKNLIYKAHFQFDDILNACDLDEPMWWQINHSDQIENILTSLTEAIRGKLDFLEVHKPSNRHQLRNTEYDYEGFVLYRILENGELDYNKIKTEEYYKTHKYKAKNMNYLIELEKTAGDHFPLTRIIKNFKYECESKLLKVCEEIITLLNEKQESNLLFQNLSEKAKVSYQKQNYETQMKMLVNASQNTWSESILKIMSKYFTELQNISEEKLIQINSVNKALVMEISPWKSDYEKRITTMVNENHRLIAELLDACITI